MDEMNGQGERHGHYPGMEGSWKKVVFQDSA